MTVLVLTQNGESSVVGGGPLVVRTLPAAPDSPPTAVTIANITDNQGDSIRSF
jgi:hypothetical protein